MLQENDFLPFQTSDLPDGPWLVFAPHPDDETFGMGGTLLLGSRRGIAITLVVLTDGALGGSKDDMVSIREKEARDAARRLGVRELVFWRQPDRGLSLTEDLIQRVAQLVREKAPASVFFTSPLEPHPDHRTTSVLAWEGLKRCAGFSGRAYAYEVSVQCPANRLIDISEVADEKAAVMAVYASQLKQNRYIEFVMSLNITRTYTLPPEVTHAEAFYAYGAVKGRLREQIISALSAYWHEEALPAGEQQSGEQEKPRQPLDPINGSGHSHRGNACRRLRDWWRNARLL